MEDNIIETLLFNIMTENYQEKIDLAKDFKDYLKSKKKNELLYVYLLYKFAECKYNLGDINEKAERLQTKRKDEIIEEIIEFLNNNMPSILAYFNSRQKNDIKKIIQKDGCYIFGINEQDLTSLDIVKILSQLNFIFCKRENGRVNIHMPQFIKDKISSCIDNIEENKLYSEIALYTQGIADTYGELKVENAYDIIKRDIDVEFPKYILIISFISTLELAPFVFDFENILNFNTIDYEFKELDDNIELAVYNKEFYEDMATDNYIMHLNEYKEFTNFLENMYDCNLDEDIMLREEIICSYIDFAQIDEQKARERLNQFIDMYFETDDFGKMVIIEYIEKIRKEMPSWKAGGRIENFARKLNIGRNDKCYCGSGKKYKNCCGKFF